ncbi:glutathione S-transferase family protein [Rhodoferax ferrireducens]|uniref:glutathione S-transferase family protein n=1 Tax=Rhodoferax ferrireducens TaxID=192843 RepID=UPI000E0CEDAE|nr:glutathione S-transferase family protein [Rhodoferax ferrireducens]
MTDIILHHYPLSPFAEKIRMVLGYKKLAWKSVIIPSIMPKPDVLALTGGYRKTPVLQIGSDVYCDSALICDVLEHLQPEPTLYPAQHKGLARVMAQWADTTLFWAAMAYTLQPKGAATLFEGAPPEVAQAFGADRGAMSAGMTRLRPADATAAYKSYLRRIANMLEGQDYLTGSAPCVADFATYHPLWFSRHRVPVMAGILDATPTVLAWMDRMAALGHGQMEKLSASESIAVCARSTGATALNDTIFQDEHGIALGSRVTVAAETFGQEPTEGVLLAATRTHYTLRRVDERAGTVQVHFPRIGYVLKKAES